MTYLSFALRSRAWCSFGVLTFSRLVRLCLLKLLESASQRDERIAIPVQRDWLCSKHSCSLSRVKNYGWKKPAQSGTTFPRLPCTFGALWVISTNGSGSDVNPPSPMWQGSRQTLSTFSYSFHGDLGSHMLKMEGNRGPQFCMVSRLPLSLNCCWARNNFALC